jgi:hypothetical protein
VSGAFYGPVVSGGGEAAMLVIRVILSKRVR